MTGLAGVPRRLAGAGIRSLLPEFTRRWLRRRLAGWPLGIGPPRRLSPASPLFGLEGEPIDRFYIEDFLGRHRTDIVGKVLEIGDDRYTRRFGGSRVTRVDVLNVLPGNPKATIVADLTSAGHVASESFDCIILTQTLQMIYDIEASVKTLCRILTRDGVLLATLPGIAPISRYDMDRWGDFWRFTTLSARRLFETAFEPSRLTIEAYGNLLSATAFLYGLAADDLAAKELRGRDEDYELVIAVRATRGQRKPPVDRADHVRV
jgi:SAM-dependent methyltransferase